MKFMPQASRQEDEVANAVDLFDRQPIPVPDGTNDEMPTDEADTSSSAASALPRRCDAYPPLADALEIGDPGRQGEVVPVQGPLSVGVCDTELDFATVEPLELRACATRGASHRHAGTPRQDAFCTASDEARLVVCVADGVSEGEHSEVAAVTAARAACKLALDASLDPGGVDWTATANRISRRILDEARYRRIVDLTNVDDPAEQIRVVQREMSTTVIVAVVSRVADENGLFPFVLAVLAGDSGAYLLKSGKWTIVAGGKENAGSGITDGAVHPLPGPATPFVLNSTLAPGQVLLLTSDGIGDPMGDGSGAVGEMLAKRWATPPTAAEFFTDVNFRRRSFDDDRTAVGVWVLPVADAVDQ